MPDAARAVRPQTTTGITPAPAPPPARIAAPPARAAATTTAPPAVRLQAGGAKGAVGPEQGKKLVRAAGPGEPLPETVRAELEKSLGADLSGVRVHRGPQASAAVDALSARAVTYGANVFLGPRERPTDLALLAHEVAHVVQQQGAPKIQKLSDAQTADSFEAEAHRASAAVVRGERFEVRERTSGSRAQRWGMDTVLNKIAGWANAIPGFRMFTIVLGVNPINMSPVERSPANVMRAVVEFIPGGNLITRALDTYGVFDKVGAWVSQQIASLGMVGGAIKDALMAFLRSLDVSDFLDPGGVWERAKSIFTDPIERIKNFVKGFITGILDFLRDAIMKPLAALASKTDGYDLLKAVLGKDPITGEAVPQTADALIGGFMKLIGQTEVWENIKKGNAVARAFAWFKETLSGVLAFVRQVPTLIITTLKSIVLDDLLPLTNLFGKVGRAFGGFIGNFFSWAGGQVLKLLEIIFEVVAPSAVPYIKKAAGAFKSIVSNPVGFVGNLVRAGMLGFQQFAGNFLKHLRKSLVDWLTGTMSGAAIYIPQSFTLREIIKFALSVLGLTWANIRQKLVKAVGETAVKAMEAGFDIVVTLVTEGPGAAWEKIKEGVSNLQQMVMDQVMSFVKQKVVEQAITKLLSMLSPAGAFIQAIIATYNTIMFFVERLRQIAQVAASFIDSIAAIASGNIGSAAKRVETTMAGLLTLVISFLARIAGLGKVSAEVIKIVNKVRAPIDKALDKVIDWIVATARRLGKFVAQAGVPQDPNERLRLGSRAALAVLNRFRGRPVGAAVLRPLLPAILTRYGLTSLEPFARNGRWWVRARINPQTEAGSEAQTEGGARPGAAEGTPGPAEAERQRQAIAATTAELRSLVAAGVPKARLDAAVNSLRARYRWVTLEVQPAAGGRLDVRGGFSPQVNLISVEGSLWVVELVNMKVPDAMQAHWRKYEEWVRNNIAQGQTSPGLLQEVHAASGVAAPPRIVPVTAAGRTQIPTGTPLPTGEVQFYREANIGAVPRTPTTAGRGPLYRPDAVIMAPQGIVYVEITLKSDWAMLEASLAGARTADRINSQRIHKVSQIPGTAAWFLQNFPASSGFTVVIICNAEPSPTSKASIQTWLRTQLYQTRNVEVVWMIAR